MTRRSIETNLEIPKNNVCSPFEVVLAFFWKYLTQCRQVCWIILRHSKHLPAATNDCSARSAFAVFFIYFDWKYVGKWGNNDSFRHDLWEDKNFDFQGYKQQQKYHNCKVLVKWNANKDYDKQPRPFILVPACFVSCQQPASSAICWTLCSPF